MEIQLQELIAKIKEDGVRAAEAEAEAILNEAKAKAEKLIADAKDEAQKLIADAKAEKEKIVANGEESLRQAGRNLLISFRESVARQLAVILEEKVSQVYSSDNFAKLIVSVVEEWAKKPDTEDLCVILNSDDLKALESTVFAALKENMLGGVTLCANDNFDGGFRISAGDGSAYYDYSAEAVAEMLSNYLSPKVTALLKEAE